MHRVKTKPGRPYISLLRPDVFRQVILGACVAALALCAPIASKAQALNKTVRHLGKVNFPTSCLPAVDIAFNDALALLVSFEYDFAHKVFTGVTQCAIAYWGLAMSLYHQLWVGPSAQTLQEGRIDIEKAEALGAKTEREQAYIHAAALFYQDSPAMDSAARAMVYSNAMAVMRSDCANSRERGFLDESMT
jgi:hypothetical protein